MKNTQDAYIQHVTSSGLFSSGSVNPYAGEAEGAGSITAALPAAFVNVRGAELGPRDEYAVHVLVAGKTTALKKQEGAQNAMERAGELAEWLCDNHHFDGPDGRTYQIKVQQRIKTGLVKITGANVIYLVSFQAEAW